MRAWRGIGAFVAVTAAGAGCTSLLGLDGEYTLGDTGAGSGGATTTGTGSGGATTTGAGGHGGATTTGTGSGGATTTSTGSGGATTTSTGRGGAGGTTTGSGGAGGGCADPCVPENDCRTATCAAGTCVRGNQPKDYQPTVVSGDCYVVTCDGVGSPPATSVDDSDLPDDGDPCTNDLCTNGQPGHSFVASGGPCPGGGHCDGKGKCVGQCADGSKGDDEADVDCGGVCVKCGVGKTCVKATDCQSSHCVDGVCCGEVCAGGCEACSQQLTGSANGQCMAVKSGTDPGGDCLKAELCGQGAACTCDDGVKDGDETDVDCGGSRCAPCPHGRACVSPSDCAVGSCSGGHCGDGCAAGQAKCGGGSCVMLGDPANCGACGRSCNGSPCEAGHCQAWKTATVPNLAYGWGRMAVLDGYAFVVRDGAAGLDRVTLADGKVQEWANAAVKAVVADGGHVYWATDKGVLSRSTSTGSLADVKSGLGAIFALALDALGIYFVKGGTDVQRIDYQGVLSAKPLASGLTKASRLAVTAKAVYVDDDGTTLRRFPLDGSASTVVHSGAGPMLDLAADATSVYFAVAAGNGADGAVYRYDDAFGKSTLATGVSPQTNVVVDGTSVYVGVDPSSYPPPDGGFWPAVLKVDRRGKSPAVLTVTNTDAVVSLAVTADRVVTVGIKDLWVAVK
jgi:hypothetical protein